MSEDLVFIVARYPSFRNVIEDEHAHNEEFKTLCEDIHAMAQTLERREQFVFATVHQELEYRKLLLELEHELLKFLSRSMHS